MTRNGTRKCAKMLDAIKGKVDPLAALKENVIIGKLTPAGTGLPEVREDLKLSLIHISAAVRRLRLHP